MAKRTNDESQGQSERFAEVTAALAEALGKPKRERGGVACYPAPEAKLTRAWIARVHAAGGSAALGDAYPKRVLAVVEGPPSGLMGLVTWVSWQFPRARKTLDILDREAGLRVENIKYTNFVIKLERVPKNPEVHARRLAKEVMMGDPVKITASLRKRRWHTGS